MLLMVLRSVVLVLSAILVILGTGMVYGQPYPNKTIRIVCAAAGGGGDAVARQIAQGISGPLGQPVLIDNRSGAVITGEIVSKAAPDGYTLLLPGSSFWTGALLQKMPYDPIKDFSPITITHSQPFVLVVHPSLPVKSVKELIDLAKAKPGELNYGSTSIGSTAHLSAELFKSMAHVNMVHIPLRGASGLVIALLGGQVQLSFSSSGSIAPHIKTGKVRGLAVTSAQPSALVPGLPTVAASGVPGFESTQKAGIFAPAKTPAAIINRLNRETVQYLQRPEVKQQFFEEGVETVGSSPQELGTVVKSEMARMGKVIKDAGIRTDGVF